MVNQSKRCVITGLGMVCAIGNNVEECWRNALDGKSGIEHTHTHDTAGCYSDYAAEVHCDALDTPENVGMDRVSKLCLKATAEAMSDAGLASFGGDEACSVIMGSCVGGAISVGKYYNEGKNPDVIMQMPISAIAAQVAKAVGAGGVVANVANACAAGTISIAHAADLIRAGRADVVVAGGADAFAAVPYAGFLSLHALADGPCLPFNHSAGLTLGEGAGALIVESYDHAVARGAKIYCEVLGSGITSDAHHITAPREDGEGQMHAIYKALENSGLNEGDIGYINAHGTGTAKNDGAEFLSLHTIFDGKNNGLSVSSTKSMTGHCLGAAGAIEAVFSVKALTQNAVPPTVGYSEEDLAALKDKAGDIEFVANKGHEKPLHAVMSNSFAFGGNNASIIFGEKTVVDKTPGRPNVFITGIGSVLPAGNGISSYVEACNNGAAISAARATVATDDYNSVGLKMAFYRKLDRLSQMQAVSGMQALMDGGYEVTADNAFDIGIAVGTADGAVEPTCDFQMLISEHGNGGGSAFKFPNTVYNAAGGYLSICSGIKGYNVTVTSGAQSGLFGIAYATTVIRQGDAHAFLACGTDVSSDIMDELYGAIGLTCGDNIPPYSMSGEKFRLTDGSVSMLLEDEESATARGAQIYCRVAGYGAAHHAVDFGRLAGSGEALDRAIAGALADAGMDVGDIDAVIGFANGHKVIDGIELDSLRRVFKDPVPVISVKERAGEGRGATAALCAAHAALMLHGDIALDECAYIIDKNEVKRTAVCSKKLKNVLVISYGAGGTYCAVILSK